MVLAVLPLPAPIIIIKSIELEFDSCHLSPIDHLDQKIINKIFSLTFISILFDIQHLTVDIDIYINFTLTLMTKAFTIDQKTTWSNG